MEIQPYNHRDWIYPMYKYGRNDDIKVSKSGSTFRNKISGNPTLTSENLSELMTSMNKDMSSYCYGTFEKDTIKETKNKPMNALKKLFLSKNVKTLVKAGYLDSELDLTENGEDALDAILLEANIGDMVKLAEETIKEQKDV